MIKPKTNTTQASKERWKQQMDLKQYWGYFKPDLLNLNGSTSNFSQSFGNAILKILVSGKRRSDYLIQALKKYKYHDMMKWLIFILLLTDRLLFVQIVIKKSC